MDVSLQVFIALTLLCCLLVLDDVSAKKMKHSEWTDEELDIIEGWSQDDGDDDIMFLEPIDFKPFCKIGCRFVPNPLLKGACSLACRLLNRRKPNDLAIRDH